MINLCAVQNLQKNIDNANKEIKLHFLPTATRNDIFLFHCSTHFANISLLFNKFIIHCEFNRLCTYFRNLEPPLEICIIIISYI